MYNIYFSPAYFTHKEDAVNHLKNFAFCNCGTYKVEHLEGFDFVESYEGVDMYRSDCCDIYIFVDSSNH